MGFKWVLKDESYFETKVGRTFWADGQRRRSIGWGEECKAEVANRQPICWTRPADVFRLACEML